MYSPWKVELSASDQRPGWRHCEGRIVEGRCTSWLEWCVGQLTDYLQSLWAMDIGWEHLEMLAKLGSEIFNSRICLSPKLTSRLAFNAARAYIIRFRTKLILDGLRIISAVLDFVGTAPAVGRIGRSASGTPVSVSQNSQLLVQRPHTTQLIKSSMTALHCQVYPTV